MTICKNCGMPIKRVYKEWRHTLHNNLLCYPLGYLIFPDDKAEPNKAEGK